MVRPDGDVFTVYGVATTNAPPPLKPLGGRAGLTRKPVPITHKPAVPVDWSFWPASRRVKRDEAIALSLDLDPHTLYSSTDGHINPDFCPDNATAILFLKRLNLLTACDSRTNILLSDFAAWAVSNLPSIPLDLAAMAHKRVDVPEQIDAPATVSNTAPAKVGGGEAAIEDEQPEPVTDGRPSGEDADAQIALLFDPVTVAALEKMFPADGKWAGWAEHASRNEGLKAARAGRGRFNPYLAGIWFAGKGIKGWDLAFCRRRLGSNLPARSLDSKHLLTGELE